MFVKKVMTLGLLTLVTLSQAAFGDENSATWTIHSDNPASPLTLTHGPHKLELMKGAGPVFVHRGERLHPGDYTVVASATTKSDGEIAFRYTATAEGFSSTYTMALKPLSDHAMEVTIGGGNDVAEWQMGIIAGSGEPLKQFCPGQRDNEAYPTNDGLPAPIYWPQAGMYLYGEWDADSAHSSGMSHRMPPKANFAAMEMPISCDARYAVLTNGTRAPLKERYVLRTGVTPWAAYGPVQQKPSEYREELRDMVFLDLWDFFAPNIEFVQWLTDVTKGQARFYSVVQQWGLAFDETIPDFYRIPDHKQPNGVFGSASQREQLVKLCNALGRTALRTNYLAAGGKESFSFKEGLFTIRSNSDGSPGFFSNLASILTVVRRQENDIKRDFATNAAFSDQLTSGGYGGPFVDFNAASRGAGTLSEARHALREISRNIKEIQQGPLGSESLISEFLLGEFVDTGDFQVFGADSRYDFTPEYKLRRLHELTTTHSMGLGYRFFFGPWEADWQARGNAVYFGDDEKLDSYRACEVLYGNGGYLFYYPALRKVHAMTEVFTVGVAQRHYALQRVDYVKYGLSSRWRTLEQIIPDAKEIDDVRKWFKQFHVRYENGCHVWVNRAEENLEVELPNGQTVKLPKNGWLVYTEDGNLLAYTALANDGVVAGNDQRVDFCEDKARGVRYVNPRRLATFMSASKPTLWVKNERAFVLADPQATFAKPTAAPRP